jgi:hypothetical protein
MFGFNCILRALETSNEEKHEALGKTLRKFSPHYIAFDTYGEQLNGLHINQTFVAVAFEKAAWEQAYGRTRLEAKRRCGREDRRSSED